MRRKRRVVYNIYYDVHMMYPWCTIFLHIHIKTLKRGWDFIYRSKYYITCMVLNDIKSQEKGIWCAYDVHMMYTWYTMLRERNVGYMMYIWCTNHVHWWGSENGYTMYIWHTHDVHMMYNVEGEKLGVYDLHMTYTWCTYHVEWRGR